MATLPDQLKGLTVLSRATLPARDYYASLLQSDDEIIRVATWSTLLDREEVLPEDLDGLVALCRYGAIRFRAFRCFEAMWRHDLAERAATMATAYEGDVERLLMAAMLARDEAKEAEAQRARFLATGKTDALLAWIRATELSSGPASAIPVAITTIIARPHEPTPIHLLFVLLREAGELSSMEALVDLLDRSRMHAYLSALHRAALYLAKGEAQKCLQQLGAWSRLKSAGDIVSRTQRFALSLQASAHEKLGNYRAAYKSFSDMNAYEDGRPIPLASYLQAVNEDTRLEVPALPPDPHTGHHIMLGFPRSGTTLLENVLAMHEKVETFEEVPAYGAIRMHLRTSLRNNQAEGERVAAFVDARECYHAEFAGRRKKPLAPVTVDKMPLRSGDAVFLSKIMPDMRYIFSIRHPFDVVLSCFKQDFKRNSAMEHFRTFRTSVSLYDFVLERWFRVHTLQDENVCYLRYDDLVTDFDGSIRRVTNFLGVDWDESVRNFTDGAAARTSRTPSYAKVRQGLGIGVQSSWKKYDFLFNTPEAKPLHKWAEFFGYPTN